MDRIKQIHGQSYGQRRPSLTAVLRRILEGYPDGGQILKELIQNADDACATEVKFLFDSRDNAYGNSTLVNQDLSRFQGPALYVYNNGRFRDKDWHGIEGIMQGNKRLDPLSAGRFGVGFNSVYHITDFPSVLSGTHIAFLDPQETFFGTGETGRRFNLSEPLLEQYPDQFSPYENVLGCKISSGVFDGTLFRLPLRKWPSRVSVKPYTASKVKALFESFISEAALILLFLKNVESISIYETMWNEGEKLIFSIRIQDSLTASIKAMKAKFIEVALNPLRYPYEMTYEVTVEEIRPGRDIKEHKYMILNRVGSESQKLKDLAKHLHLFPWAGVAAPLDNLSTKVPPTGRVFCFLPLPPESDCRTGLTVHIHGTFGVSDNRRNLKWPGSECQNDDFAMWNNLLLEEVISVAYANLLVNLTQSQYPCDQILQVVSAILPDLERVQGHWKQILEPFFRQLADKAVFWTKAEGGKWIMLQDALLNRLARSPSKTRPEVRAAVVKVLLLANQPVVTLPDHALKAMDEYLLCHVTSVQEITPSFVRSVLKGEKSMRKDGSTKLSNGLIYSERDNNDNYNVENEIANQESLRKTSQVKCDWSVLDRDEKICLLEFLMKDGAISEMAGLPLLPLADNTFTIFYPNALSANPEAAVFLASRLHPQSLVPGSAHRFLDERISEGILEVLRSVAVNAEKQNTNVVAPTQLVLLAPILVPQLLKQALPERWKGPEIVVSWDPRGNEAPEAWLKQLWSWLRTEFPTDLSAFEGVPLIPLTTLRSEAGSLIKLKKTHNVVQGSSHFASLPRNVSSALQKAGCIVLSHVPVFCDHLDLRQYLESPTPSGVIKVLASVLDNEGVASIKRCTSDEKRCIRAFLSSLRNPSDDEVLTLMALPIFEAISGTFTAVQPDGPLRGEKLDVAPPRFKLPDDVVVPESHLILSAGDDDSYQLLRRLPIRVLNMSDFLIEKVFPFIEAGTFYSRNQVANLMVWVLQRLPVLSSDNRAFPEHLKTLRFIPISKGKFQAPCELFDPEDETLKKLFEGEPSAFPSQEFSTTHALSLLRVFLGMRRSGSLEGKDVLKIAKQISAMSTENAPKRAQALMTFLNENTSLLDSKVGTDQPGVAVDLASALSTLPWIPSSTEPPVKYPSTMPWYSSDEILHSASEMRDVDAANLVGSTMPIMQGDIDSKLKRAFGWDKPPPTSHVIKQLKAASEVWISSQKRPSEVEILKFRTMLREIYDRLSVPEALPETTAFINSSQDWSWVWYGSGFALPKCVAFQSTCPINLKPYIFYVSEDFRNYSPLFKACGVQENFGEERITEVLALVKESYLKGTKNEGIVKRDLHLCREILHHITRNGDPLPEELREKVLVPVQSTDGQLRLELCNDVYYYDSDWLKLRGGDDVTFTNVIHESISTHTAQLLGVQPLSRSLAMVEAFGFEQSEPREPVNIRLRNILREYKDGLSVLKELIQNAEEAGANEVKFLVDWRENPHQRVLSKGMSEAQGPALWVYNDAVFTDKDFENIKMLASTTTTGSAKRGRPGIGFCSVFNITDIPSFISREFIVMFDPQTTYLGNVIKDKTRPGIRLNLKENSRAVAAFSDQFSPYNKIFGCSILEQGKEFFYNGTLFRLPFRTLSQAQTSVISGNCYDESNISKLLGIFREHASSLLLFLRNVKRISVHEIKASDHSVDSPEMVFQIDRGTIEVIPRNEPILSRSYSHSISEFTGSPLRQSSSVIALKSSTSPNKMFNTAAPQSSNEVWLTSFCSGHSLSVELAASAEGQLNGLVSQAGVASLLSSQGFREGLWKPEPVSGEAFSSLPLSMETGLPVHVNGCFAVTNNRRGLWEESNPDQKSDRKSDKPFEALWNKVLLEDAASTAYVQLLKDMVRLIIEGKVAEFDFQEVWPDPDKIPSKLWRMLANRVYQGISESEVPLMQGSTVWVQPNKAVFLDEKLSELSGCKAVAELSEYQIVELKPFARKAFIKAGLSNVLTQQTLTVERFLQEAFLPNIKEIPTGTRDQIVCFVLDEYSSGSTNLGELIEKFCCIPAGDEGQSLLTSRQLIDPEGAAAGMYSAQDNRFPFGEDYRKRFAALRNLGMVKDMLPWEAICERIESVAKLAKNNREHALQRIQNIISYLNTYLSKMIDPTRQQKEAMRSYKFLPALNHPEGYCLPWKGAPKALKRGITLLSADELYPAKYVYLLGTIKPILDESTKTGCGEMKPEVARLFGIQKHEPALEDVLFQLSSAVQCTRKKTPINVECIQEICLVIYRYLQLLLTTSQRDAVLEVLSEKPWVFVSSKFVASNQVAFSWTGHGAPFLYQLPQEFTNKFRILFEAAGIRETFTADDYIDALFALRERKQEERLTEVEFKTTKTFLDEIAHMDQDLVNSFQNHLPMPDQDRVLRPVGELVVNDAPWLEDVEFAHVLHPDIPTHLAHRLGAQTMRDVTLSKYSHGLGKPLSQKEPLTERIRNALSSYPRDEGILKEMLQSADDAKATEFHVIYDPRQHNKKRVLSEGWKDLQGPAICVYNDCPFTEERMESFQQIGRTAKSEESDKAFGFNTIYHLTDCPSFITDNSTICILDPHATHAPDVTRETPGRILQPLDDEFRENFVDVFKGYLEDFFNLEGATMLRFPLRTKINAEKSEISKLSFEDVDVDNLLKTFEHDVKDSLLFLNSVRKVTISRIENGRLVKKYQASATLPDESEEQLQTLSSEVIRSKGVPTADISYFGVTYKLVISDSERSTEEWLVHQCLGAKEYVAAPLVPDGRALGFLPRAGVAAKVSVQEDVLGQHVLRALQEPFTDKTCRAFSSLPLHVETRLPVQVSGQFALDVARRKLCDDEKKDCRSRWNEFMKTEVIAPAYVHLLMSARHKITGIQEGNPWFFNTRSGVKSGLSWYHSLFPDPHSVHSDWKELSLAVFRCLENANCPVIPVIHGQEAPSSNPSTPRSPVSPSHRFSDDVATITCRWLPPTSEDEENSCYFSVPDLEINELLIKTGFPIAYSPAKVLEDFKFAGVTVKSVNPEVVLTFMKSSRSKVGMLPCLIKNSALGDIATLKALITYCMQCDNIVSRLHGLPMLLTEDDVLRRFDIATPVFYTPFADLLPIHKDLFLHSEFVEFFSAAGEKTMVQTGIFKRFDTKSLGPYVNHLLPPSWCAAKTHVQWAPSSKKPSRDWMTLLWQLIHKTFFDRQSSFSDDDDCTETLRPLEDWPIVPTNQGTLVSVNMGKTVFDFTSRDFSEDKLVVVLRKLGCPEVDFSMLPGLKVDNLSQVLSSYLAKAHSRIDVISVLEHLMKDNELTVSLNENEILVLFKFLQEDVTTVYSHKSLLRSMPFFQTLHGKFVSLLNYSSAHVLELPECIPLKDIELRVEMEGCVLLRAVRELEPFYKAVDIFRVSQSEVFVKYILPNLDALKDEDRQSVLGFIRDSLLVTTNNPNERSVIIDTLIDTNILPDKSGELCPASRFHDPANEVFKSMLSEDSFPPGDYASEAWLPLLRQIGLKKAVTQQDFIEYSESVASSAETDPSNDELRAKSKALVQCLLEEEILRDACFLHLISQIKFVSPEIASENLRNLHTQFECQSKDDSPPFIAFHGSISQECERFLWSTAPLLPSWALPQKGENQRMLVDNLGIEVAPPLEKVIKHLENLSLQFKGNVNKDTPKDQRELLHDIIYAILSFFKTEASCTETEASERCSKSCLAIGNILQKIPCIPVEEGRVFVEGDQLAFETLTEMPPFLYKVPREYGHFEHVLKRLGAEEKPTPLQFAKVLERLKEVCEDKPMEPNEQKVARLAAQGFFTTVSLLVKEQRESTVTALLSKINDLYLPTKEGYLKLSNELIFYDCPSFERRARDFSGDFMDIAREGELTADRLAYLLNLLPTRLRVRTIQSILREEIHPFSREKHCIADSGEEQCPFIARYRNVLLSPKLINGILRVIRHQRQTANIPQEVRDQVLVLSTMQISCMGALDTHLVQLETNTPIKNSKEVQDCFLEEQDNKWELFIKHGTDENPLHIQLCFLINRLIGNHVEKEIYLQAMLACRVPEDILPSLDRCGVAQDLLSSDKRTTDPSLGSEIPVMYHYLLRQDFEYFFRKGEIVGYERERVLEDGSINDREPFYVYAKVIRKASSSPSNSDSEQDPGKFDFQARYRIDVGEPKLLEVSVLDLYKFDRTGVDPTVPLKLSDLKDIVIFTGDPDDDRLRASTRNDRLETAKKAVKDALWEAWKLKDVKRKKVMKRLFLRWHPDKNPGSDIATEVMKFLLSEIDRLERIFPSKEKKAKKEKEKKEKTEESSSTFNDLFEQWSKRAHQERQTYNTFKRQNTSASSANSGNPQRKEARRWMKQARDDLAAAKHLVKQEPNFYGLVCFLCQQAAEKSFKSALYAACGIAESQLETHDVLNLAYEITELDNSPPEIALLAAKLKNYYEKTRYPHFHHGDVIPSEVFTSENAHEALSVSESILDQIGKFINENFAEV
ncbi:sacsin isoform X1 [Nematostella vectensis]|uniref:sacsin isoform X1 n=1 Tax=Nematostella vectensis TaxID=45351 RepID=UPI00138FE5BF|nr:sacsin isoform X1 [Nematostella vectensis]XP_032241648.1 sacsin isoform X1 [Nematostella vectensis]XP_032241650.1 sacsin isoform X1 [Nematostella vectensis]XP_048586757.1 sacsin isoform X1 [Nematostella vectensis]